jgi:hypothetical protein
MLLTDGGMGGFKEWVDGWITIHIYIYIACLRQVVAFAPKLPTFKLTDLDMKNGYKGVV